MYPLIDTEIYEKLWESTSIFQAFHERDKPWWPAKLQSDCTGFPRCQPDHWPCAECPAGLRRCFQCRRHCRHRPRFVSKSDVDPDMSRKEESSRLPTCRKRMDIPCPTFLVQILPMGLMFHFFNLALCTWMKIGAGRKCLWNCIDLFHWEH